MKVLVYLVLLTFLLVGCNGGSDSKPKPPEKKCKTIKNDESTAMTDQDIIVRDNYLAWLAKHKVKNNKNVLLFASGRLIEKLVTELNSKLSDDDVDATMAEITQIVMNPVTQRLKKLSNADYKKITKLLTGNHTDCQ